ncbi:MAG: DUF4105 domain-containing protein [Gemmatimonadetes bacterium]|nr:DUF4105 domain-containing protein [Gemmatimonadota bacterium]
MRLLPPVVGVLFIPMASLAQAPSVPPEAPGSEITISLVTVGQGPAIWERFGHNAIWVEDRARGTSRTYNYGMFDFRQESFVLRFIRGRMLYSMMSENPQAEFRRYRAQDRTVWVQELNLTPSQRIELRDTLEWNDLPENREYRYDYYEDNCSTRIRDALDRALGGEIRRQTENAVTESTLRFHTQRLTTDNVPYYTGLLIALGPSVDRPISQWQEMFLPLSVMEHLRGVTVPGPDGSRQPLVLAEHVVYESTGPAPDAAPPSWGLRYFLAGIVLASIIWWLGGGKRRGVSVAFAGLATLWALAVGILGAVLLGLWAGTDHAVAYWNENLFLFNPLSLALGVVIPFVALGARRAMRPAAILGLAVAVSSTVGFMVQVLPWLDQVNGQLYALFLLPNVAVGIRVVQLADAQVAPSS